MSNNVHRHEAYEILYESGSVSYVFIYHTR